MNGNGMKVSQYKTREAKDLQMYLSKNEAQFPKI